jgi:hypothetical protein
MAPLLLYSELFCSVQGPHDGHQANLLAEVILSHQAAHSITHFNDVRIKQVDNALRNVGLHLALRNI